MPAEIVTGRPRVLHRDSSAVISYPRTAANEPCLASATSRDRECRESYRESVCESVRESLLDPLRDSLREPPPEAREPTVGDAGCKCYSAGERAASSGIREHPGESRESRGTDSRCRGTFVRCRGSVCLFTRRGRREETGAEGPSPGDRKNRAFQRRAKVSAGGRRRCVAENAAGHGRAEVFYENQDYGDRPGPTGLGERRVDRSSFWDREDPSRVRGLVESFSRRDAWCHEENEDSASRPRVSDEDEGTIRRFGSLDESIKRLRLSDRGEDRRPVAGASRNSAEGRRCSSAESGSSAKRSGLFGPPEESNNRPRIFDREICPLRELGDFPGKERRARPTVLASESKVTFDPEDSSDKVPRSPIVYPVEKIEASLVDLCIADENVRRATKTSSRTVRGKRREPEVPAASSVAESSEGACPRSFRSEVFPVDAGSGPGSREERRNQEDRQTRESRESREPFRSEGSGQLRFSSHRSHGSCSNSADKEWEKEIRSNSLRCPGPRRGRKRDRKWAPWRVPLALLLLLVAFLGRGRGIVGTRHHGVGTLAIGAASAIARAASALPLELIGDSGVRAERSANLSHITGASRKIQMYIKNRHLQILPDGTVNGSNDDTSDYTIFQRTSVSRGQLRIQGVATCLYLCMDSCGLLYGSREYTEDCVFNETLEQHNYNTYSSVRWSTARKTLYLGLNRRGQPRRVQARGHNLGRLSAYARVLTQVAPPDRVESLQQRMLGAEHEVRHRHDARARHHEPRDHRQLCPSLPPQEKDGRDRFRCRKRKKRKKRKRKCRPDETPGPQCEPPEEGAADAPPGPRRKKPKESQSGAGGKNAASKRPGATLGKPGAAGKRLDATLGKPGTAEKWPNVTLGEPGVQEKRPNATLGKPGSVAKRANATLGKPGAVAKGANAAARRPGAMARRADATLKGQGATSGKPEPDGRKKKRKMGPARLANANSTLATGTISRLFGRKQKKIRAEEEPVTLAGIGEVDATSSTAASSSFADRWRRLGIGEESVTLTRSTGADATVPTTKSSNLAKKKQRSPRRPVDPSSTASNFGKRKQKARTRTPKIVSRTTTERSAESSIQVPDELENVSRSRDGGVKGDSRSSVPESGVKVPVDLEDSSGTSRRKLNGVPGASVLPDDLAEASRPQKVDQGSTLLEGTTKRSDGLGDLSRTEESAPNEDASFDSSLTVSSVIETTLAYERLAM